MKPIALLTLLAVLTAALMTGCGCTNPDLGTTSAPTVLPTNGEPTTRPTTMPTTQSTQATVPTEATIDHGNGPLDDATIGTTAATAATEPQTRMMPQN